MLHQHEQAGKNLMLEHGVQLAIAQSCVSPASWQAEGVSFEELTVALADKLWKGKCESELEMLVIDQATQRTQKDRWDLFTQLDTLFEEIASEGEIRLAASR